MNEFYFFLARCAKVGSDVSEWLQPAAEDNRFLFNDREHERTGLRVVRVAYCLAFVFALSPFESMANWTGALIEGEGKLSLRGQIIWVGDFRSRAFEGKTSTEVRLVEDFGISLCLEVFC